MKNIMDRSNNLQIYASLSNTSPVETIENWLSRTTKSSVQYTIPSLGIDESISVILLFNKEDNITVYPRSTSGLVHFNNTYVQ